MTETTKIERESSASQKSVLMLQNATKLKSNVGVVVIVEQGKI